MTVVVNCDCDVAFESKTRAQLRTACMEALGFIDPLSAGTKTLLQLRTEIKDRLGLATAITTDTVTALEIVTATVAAIGAAAMGSSLSPGTRDMVLTFADEAQSILYRRLELDKGGTTAPTALSLDTDATVLDGPPVIALTIALTKAHHGQQDAKIYLDQVERYLADQVGRAPPNIDGLVDSALREAQETVYRRYAVGNSGTITIAALTADADTTTGDYHATFLLALGNIKAKVGQPDAKALLEQYEQHMQDALRRSPPDATTRINQALKMAQEQLYRRYDVFRMERFYTWTLTTDRFYGIAANDEQTAGTPCLKALDPRKITWAGVCDENDNCWRPLRKGILPNLYVSGQTGVPTHYEIRQCVEVWPTPIAGWKLRIKGDFGLDDFDADDDTTTIDWQAVQLQAVASLKAAYKMPDAQMALVEAREYIGDLVAGSHMSARYFPGQQEPRNAVRPVMV